MPSMVGGGEVIADALVSGTLGIDTRDDDGSVTDVTDGCAGAGAGVRAGTGAGAGVDVGVGAGAGAGAGGGAAQASKLAANTNIKGINITGIMDFRFILVPLFQFNLPYG